MNRGREEREEFFCFENLGFREMGLHQMVTVRVVKWFYHIPRVKLTIIEGIYKSSEDIDAAIRKAEEDIRRTKVEDANIRPIRFFEVVCHPESLLHLTEVIRTVCGSEVEPRSSS